MNETLPLPLTEVIIRLGVATILGGALGLNRELNNKPAGLRTLTLVALASAVAATGVSLLEGTTPDAISRVGQGRAIIAQFARPCMSRAATRALSI